MSITKHKVFAYITHGDRLLVFRHPFAPEAGIQVPAGTVERDEAFDVAVLREAFEETGLTNLQLIRPLGEQVREMADFGRDEIHHRHFYHLLCTDETPATWRHVETHPSDDSGEHVFEFFWVTLPNDVPELIADHGKLLAVLWAYLVSPSREGKLVYLVDEISLPARQSTRSIATIDAQTIKFQQVTFDLETKTLG